MLSFSTEMTTHPRLADAFFEGDEKQNTRFFNFLFTSFQSYAIMWVRHNYINFRYSVHFYYGKNVCSLFRTLCREGNLCRSNGGMRFSCVASAAHFFIFKAKAFCGASRASPPTVFTRIFQKFLVFCLQVFKAML